MGATAYKSSVQTAKERLEREYHIKDLGAPDSLLSSTMQIVAENNFDRAIHELEIYKKMKSTFPLYVERTERYFEHCIEIIEALRVKKSVPMNSLPAAKRQELSTKIVHHFHELMDALNKIYEIENDLRVDDAKSTVWVLKAFFICVFSLILLGFALEAWRSMGIPAALLFNDIADWILLKIGF